MSLRQSIGFAALAASLALGCVKYGGGSAVVDPYIYEVESNDFYWTANGIGPISVGQTVLIRGSVSDFGSDRFDGFAFRANSPMKVYFRLYADSWTNDFDLALFDPYTLATIATWETAAQPEAGDFYVYGYGTEFHLVVNSFAGSGEYTLEISAFNFYGDAPAQGMALAAAGEHRPGNAIDWSAYARDQLPLVREQRRAWVEVRNYLLDERTGRLIAPPQRAWVELPVSQ
jgi:hypothetical protein